VLSTSRVVKNWLKTQEFLHKLTEVGCLEINGETYSLTDLGKSVGGEFKNSKRFGD